MNTRSHEGYLFIDHRDSPGVPDEIAVPGGFSSGALGPGKIFECATYTCSHCERVENIDPKRPNGAAYLCRGCGHLLCDRCGKEKVRTGICRPFKALVSEFLEAADRHPETVEESFKSIFLTGD